MTFMRPPPSTTEQSVPATHDEVLRQAYDRVSYLVGTSSPVWDRELRWPPGSGDRLAAMADVLAQARHTLHHAEVRAAIIDLLRVYDAWEIQQSQTDVRAVARPPPR